MMMNAPLFVTALISLLTLLIFNGELRIEIGELFNPSTVIHAAYSQEETTTEDDETEDDETEDDETEDDETEDDETEDDETEDDETEDDETEDDETEDDETEDDETEDDETEDDETEDDDATEGDGVTKVDVGKDDDTTEGDCAKDDDTTEVYVGKDDDTTEGDCATEVEVGKGDCATEIEVGKGEVGKVDGVTKGECANVDGDPSIHVETDKKNYQQGETVQITGTVGGFDKYIEQVGLTVEGPEYTYNGNLPTDGTFGFNIKDMQGPAGTYTVTAYYGEDLDASTTFVLVAEPPIPLSLSVVTNKNSYQQGETVQITGEVSGLKKPGQVGLTVEGPEVHLQWKSTYYY